MTNTVEQIIARHLLGAMRDVLGLKDSVPDEVNTTAAIVAAECVAELEGGGHTPYRVESIEQLNALPRHAAVRWGMEIYQHLGDGWWATMREGLGAVYHSEQLLDMADDDPVVVLWVPAKGAQS